MFETALQEKFSVRLGVMIGLVAFALLLGVGYVLVT